MSLENDVAAVRGSVGLTEGDHIAAVRVVGADVHELLDRVSPRQLFVRSGQMLQTVLLDDAAKPVADIYLCCDDDDFLILAEGLDGPALAAYLKPHATGIDAAVVDLSESHGLLCLDGPYAWELLAEVTSPDVIGLPYLGFYDEGRFLCFRGGKTGEFGYDLLVERARLSAIRASLVDAGTRFGLRQVELAAIELCMLEAGFFNVRRDVRDGLTPIELQLQWRVGTGRSYPGAAALAARRTEPRGRVTLVASADEFTFDSSVELNDQSVGLVLNAGRSFVRNEWLGLALLDRQVAHAGLSGFTVASASVRTVSSPALNNRSLYIDPQRHSWVSRYSDEFPPLVRPSWS